jgi:short-subunit dehydrogenase
MLNKYGDCWVAITGFADGIGWAFANLFSELGYNLILIGRNQEKINQRAEELDSLYPNTRRNYIVADLSTDEGIDHTVTKLEELGKTLEIGIFINNAGFAAGQ